MRVRYFYWSVLSVIIVCQLWRQLALLQSYGETLHATPSLVNYSSAPDILILGVMKAGTTSLYTLYSERSCYSRKELHVWTGLTPSSATDVSICQAYTHLIREPPPVFEECLKVDNTPEYFLSKTLLLAISSREIFRKVALILRDPIDRLVSEINFRNRVGFFTPNMICDKSDSSFWMTEMQRQVNNFDRIVGVEVIARHRMLVIVHSAYDYFLKFLLFHQCITSIDVFFSENLFKPGSLSQRYFMDLLSTPTKTEFPHSNDKDYYEEETTKFSRSSVHNPAQNDEQACIWTTDDIPANVILFLRQKNQFYYNFHDRGVILNALSDEEVKRTLSDENNSLKN